MQDTHLAQYGVIRTLAGHATSFVLAVDFDQTIYEWQGSTPDKVLARFRQDFPGAVEFHFTENHRVTRRLLEATNAFAASFSRRPRPKPAAHLPPGEPIVYHFAPDGDAEAAWIASRLLRLQAEPSANAQPLRWRAPGGTAAGPGLPLRRPGRWPTGRVGPPPRQ